MSLLQDILNKKIKTTPNENEQQTIQQVLNRQIDTSPTRLGGANAPKKANLSYVTEAEQNEAARALLKSRERYNNYLQKQTASTRSQKLSKTPFIDITSRRNELEELASQNARALREASNTEEAKRLKQDMSKKQNVYNYSNYLRNVQDVENENVSGLEKVVSPWMRPLDLIDPTRLTGTTTYFDDKGNRVYLPNKRELKQQKIREESGAFLGAYNDIVSSISKAATAKVINLVSGGIGGDILYYGDIMNSGTEEALKQGYSKEESLLYGGVTTIVAGTLDKALNTFGGLTKLTGGKIPKLESAVDKFIGKFVKNKFATVLISNFTREGLSEAAEEMVDNYAKYIINSDKSDSDSLLDVFVDTLPSAGYAYLIGGLTGVGGGILEKNTKDTQERIKALTDYKNDLEKVQPNTPVEAEFKNDEINKVDNKIDELSQIQNENQTAPNRTEQIQDTKTEVNAPSEKQDAEVQEQKPSKAKNIKDAVNVANEELTLSKVEQKELNTKLSKFENMTKEQLTNKQTQDEIKSILSDYQTRSTNYEDADLKDIKKYIRNTKIKISDNVKNQISDYNEFRKSNFGNLKLTNDGTPVDEFWNELQEQYPQFSSEQVNGETDILEKLSDFVKQENTLTEEFTLSDEDMDDVTSKVFNSLIRNAESETSIPDYEISDEYDNVNIPLAKNSKDIVLKITEDSSPKQKQDVIKMLSEPQKNKVTVVAEDGTKFINPSENRNASVEEITKMVNDTVSEEENKKIDAENKKRRKSREKKLEIYKQQGNEDMVKYTQYQLDNDLYEVRHTNYEQDLQETKMEEDPEDFYKKFYKDYQDSKLNNKLTAEKRLELQDKATVLQKYYGNMELKTYNGEIAKIIDDAFFELGTPVGQLMQGRKNYYENLNRMGAEVLKEKRAMFNEEAKEHLDDPAWLKKNDPINPKSKYYTKVKDYSAINNLSKELFEIGKEKGITSDEYIEKATQLNKAIENAYGGKSLTGKLKNLTITNVLGSTRIWVQNHKGNFINLGQYEVLDNIPAVIADKIMSTQTDMRTRGISFQGDVLEGGKGFLKGYKDTFYEFKNDLSLSNKFSRESSVDIGRKSIGHTFSNNNPVGKILNGYERLVNFAIESGDRPYAMYYFEKSCYNQRMTNAQIQAKKQNTNMIYKETQNSDTGMYSVSYYDSDGKVHSGEFMTESEYKKFKETSKVQDLTEDMVNIAEQEALENTFQNDNRLTKAAVGIKKNLNNIFSVGDYGLGDVFLKFTRTGSNMARALYEHSPMEAITLTKDLIRYNENLKNIDAETGKNSVTPQMQHKVATDFGKLVGGALVYVPIAIMNWGGKGAISRKDEDDKQTKFKNVTLGSKEYSIKLPFGDYTYKLSNDSTLESLIRQGVDIADLFNQTGSVIDTFLGSANSFVNSMIDMSFMSNILDMGSSYSDPLDNIKKKLASQPANIIPSFVKDFSYTVDGFTKRNTYDENIFQYAMNQIIDRTPLRKNGLKIGNVKIEGLTPQRNSWGEVRKVGADLLSSVWNTWLSGDTLSKISDDPVSKETIDIYMSTHDTDAMPKLKLSKNSFSYNTKEFELNEKDQDDYMRIYGKTAYSSIKKLMNTSQYKNASDDYKLKLLKQAYLYADEKAKENKIKSAGESFYNYKKKDNKFTEYRKPVFEEILENDISIDEAQYKRNNPNPYKLHTSITNWENYEIISKDIKNIAKTYSKENGYDNKTRSFAVQTYISKLNGLTSVQKAMISKLENSKSDYASYDDKILSYIKSLKLTDEEYKYMYDKLGLGGYYIPIYKQKKNK